MSKPDIALVGRARAGKDTIADYLARDHGYVRVGFADALKQMAYSANPVIPDPLRANKTLSEVIDRNGWELAKDRYPEVRTFLQNLGVAVRQQDSGFWLRQGIEKVYAAWFPHLTPVVFTDVRFANEVEALESLDFLTVSVTRPCRITEGLDATDTHVSETELANYPTDRAICNSGTIADLEADVRKYLLSL